MTDMERARGATPGVDETAAARSESSHEAPGEGRTVRPPHVARIGITAKLVLVTAALVAASSFGLTAIYLGLTRTAVEEDFRRRAVVFAHGIAAAIGDRLAFESGALLDDQILRIMHARPSVLQMDVLAFRGDEARVVATSNAGVRLPFSPGDGRQARAGQTVSRLVVAGDSRYWEVLAPVRIDDALVGAIGVKFSTGVGDRLADRIQSWALALTAASVLVTALVTALVARVVVARPLRQFLDATERFRAGAGGPRVPVAGRDEFAILGLHFNRMVDQITRFNEELRQRVTEATAERDQRLREVIGLNQQLFQVQGRLRHAERLAIVGRFMAQVAHELGTPLHSVAGHLELLRRDLPPATLAGEGGRRLGVVEGQLTRMSEIIAQLLDLTRAAPGPPAPVALNALVAETVELIRPGISTKGLTVGLDLSPADPIVPGRAAQLQQVLLNLLTNAVDATAAGRIEVRTRCSGPQQVEVEVSDTGRGIPGEDLESLFDPFFTTKEPGRGVGLGLFIAAQLIREHGGTISVKSRLGEGTTFVVSLPGGGPAAR